MKKTLKILLFLLSLVGSSCNYSNPRIDYIKTKDVKIITYGNDYDYLKQFDGYQSVNTESELLNTQIDNKYRFIGINGNDVSAEILTTAMFNYISELVSYSGSCLILTGFSDYYFLNDTDFIPPDIRNVVVEKFYVYFFVRESYGYRLEETTSKEGTENREYAHFIIDTVYDKVYGSESDK
jgi:hypothetical protein